MDWVDHEYTWAGWGVMDGEIDFVMYVLNTGWKYLGFKPRDQYLAVVYVEVTLVSSQVVGYVRQL